MAQSDDLKEGLMKDIAEAEEITGISAEARGGEGHTGARGFLPSALRLQGKVIGQKELRDAKIKIDKSVERLLDIKGIQDKEERRNASFELKKRFNAFGLEMIKKSGEFKREQKKRLTDANARLRGNKLLQGAISGFTSTLVGSGALDGIFEKGPGATDAGAPSDFGTGVSQKIGPIK